MSGTQMRPIRRGLTFVPIRQMVRWQFDVASMTNWARIVSSIETGQRVNILVIGTSGLARN